LEKGCIRLREEQLKESDREKEINIDTTEIERELIKREGEKRD
jgi:hypothetical protein